MPFLALTPAALALPMLVAAQADSGVLWEVLFFFTQAGAFVFGSGLAIVPFLQ